MQKLAGVSLAFALGCVLVAPLSASQQKATLRIGTSHWPFWRTVENDTPGGADLEIWSEMARRAGVAVEFEIMTHQGYLDGLAAGTIDGAVSLIKTPERAGAMVFLEPPLRTKQAIVFYVRKGDGHRLKRYEDLRALKVGSDTMVTFPRLDEDAEIEVHHSANLEEQFLRLQNGQLDALAAVEWRGDYHLQEASSREVFEKAPYSHREYHPIHLVMSPQAPHLDKRERLEVALSGMIDDGTVKGIIDRYVPGWYEPYEKPFSIVLLPASYGAPATLERQVEWVRSNEEPRNIAFVVHSGDMVRDGTDAEWEHVDRCFRRLDGVVPYAIATGNHDVYPGKGIPRARSTAGFDQTFPLGRLQNAFSAGHLGAENMVFEVRQGATKVLLVVLEFGVRDPALEWAHDVLKAHPGWPTVLVTHAFTPGPNARNNFRWNPLHLDRSLNDRDEIWDTLVREYPDIFLLLSSHTKGERRESSHGEGGNLVHQVLAGVPESDEDLHKGWLRVLTFHQQQNKMTFETYSPVSGEYRRDATSQFEASY